MSCPIWFYLLVKSVCKRVLMKYIQSSTKSIDQLCNLPHSLTAIDLKLLRPELCVGIHT